MNVAVARAVGFALVCFTSFLLADDQEILARYERILLSDPRPGVVFDRWLAFQVDRLGYEGVVERLEGYEGGRQWAAWVLLAHVELRLGKAARAEQFARKATEAAPDRWHCWRALGDALARLERPEEAAEAYRRALSVGKVPAPEEELIYRRLAALYVTAGQNDRAREVYIELLQKFGEDEFILHEVAEELHSLGFVDDALRYYEQLARTSQSAYFRVQATAAAARLLAARGRLNESQQKLWDLIDQLAPGSWYRREALRTLVALYEEHERLDELVEALRQKAETDTDPDFVIEAARLLEVRGELVAAVQLLEKQRKRLRATAITWALAELYERVGQYADARACYRSLAEREPHRAEFWERLGQAYWKDPLLSRDKRTREAVGAWRQIFMRQPSPERALHVARLLVEHGLVEEAERYYREAVRLRSDASTYFAYADYLARTERVEEAADLLVQAWRSGDSPLRAEEVARWLVRNGQREGATDFLSEALARTEDPAARWELQSLLIEVLLAQARWQEAYELLERSYETVRSLPGRQKLQFVELLSTVARAEPGRAEFLRTWADRAAAADDPLASVAYLRVAEIVGEIGLAEQVAERLLNRPQLEPWIAELLYEFWSKGGNLAKAAKVAQRAAASRPERWLPRVVVAHQLAGKLQRAYEAAAQWVERVPEDSRAWETLIRLARTLGREDEELYRRALRKWRSPDARLRYAEYLLEQGRPEEAAAQLWWAISQADPRERERVLEGTLPLLSRLEAVEAFEQRLLEWAASSGTDTAALELIGLYYQALGDDRRAEAQFRRVLLRRPDAKEVLRRLVEVAARQFAYERVVEYGRRYLQLEPEAAGIRWQLITALIELGREDEATLLLEAWQGRATKADVAALLQRLLQSGRDQLALAVVRARLRAHPDELLALVMACLLTWADRPESVRREFEAVLRRPWPGPQPGIATREPHRTLNRPYAYWAAIERLVRTASSRVAVAAAGAGYAAWSPADPFSLPNIAIPMDDRDAWLWALVGYLYAAEQQGQLEETLRKLAGEAGVELKISSYGVRAVVEPEKLSSEMGDAMRRLLLALLAVRQYLAVWDILTAWQDRAPPEAAWLGCYLIGWPQMESAGLQAQQLAPPSESHYRRYERWLTRVSRSDHPEEAAELAVGFAAEAIRRGRYDDAARWYGWLLSSTRSDAARARAALEVFAYASKLPSALVDRAVALLRDAPVIHRAAEQAWRTADTRREWRPTMRRAIEGLIQAGRLQDAFKLTEVLLEAAFHDCWWTPKRMPGWDTVDAVAFSFEAAEIPEFDYRLPLRKGPDEFALEHLRQLLDEHRLFQKFEAHVMANPRHAPSVLTLTLWFVRGGQRLKALALMRRAVQATDDPNLKLALAQLLANGGAYKEALRVVLSIDAVAGDLREMKWRAALMLAAAAGAKDLARQAMTELARRGWTVLDGERTGLAALLKRVGIDETLAQPKQHIALARPIHRPAKAPNIARLASGLGRDATVVTSLRQLRQLSLLPLENRDRIVEIVKFLREEGLLDEVERHLWRQVKEHGDRNALRTLCSVYDAQWKPAELDRVLSEWTARGETDAYLRLWRAKAREFQGRWTEAAEDYLYVLQKQPQLVQDFGFLETCARGGQLHRLAQLVRQFAQRTHLSVWRPETTSPWHPQAWQAGFPWAGYLYRAAMPAPGEPLEHVPLLAEVGRAASPTAAAVAFEAFVQRLLESPPNATAAERLAARFFARASGPWFLERQVGSFWWGVRWCPGRQWLLSLRAGGYGNRFEEAVRALEASGSSSLRRLAELFRIGWLAAGTDEEQREAVERFVSLLRGAKGAEAQRLARIGVGLLGWLVDQDDPWATVAEHHAALARALEPHARLLEMPEAMRIFAVLARYHAQRGERGQAAAYWDRLVGIESLLQQATLTPDILGGYGLWMVQDGVVTGPLVRRYLAFVGGRPDLINRWWLGYYFGPLADMAADHPAVRPKLEALARQISGGRRSGVGLMGFLERAAGLGIAADTPEGMESRRLVLTALGLRQEAYQLVRQLASTGAVVWTSRADRYLPVLVAHGDLDAAAQLYGRAFLHIPPWPRFLVYCGLWIRSPEFYAWVAQRLKRNIQPVRYLGFAAVWTIWFEEEWLRPVNDWHPVRWSEPQVARLYDSFAGFVEAVNSVGADVVQNPRPYGSWYAASRARVLFTTGHASEGFEVLLGELAKAEQPVTWLLAQRAVPRDIDDRQPLIALAARYAHQTGRVEELMRALHDAARRHASYRPAVHVVRAYLALLKGDQQELEQALLDATRELSKDRRLATDYYPTLVLLLPYLPDAAALRLAEEYSEIRPNSLTWRPATWGLWLSAQAGRPELTQRFGQLYQGREAAGILGRLDVMPILWLVRQAESHASAGQYLEALKTFRKAFTVCSLRLIVDSEPAPFFVGRWDRDPAQLYVEVLRKAAEVAGLRAYEESLRKDLQRLHTEAPDAEPAVQLAVVLLSTGRAAEAAELMASVPADALPCAFAPVLAAAAAVAKEDSDDALRCVEEYVIRWPWAAMEHAHAVAGLYDRFERELPTWTPRWREAIRRWADKARLTDAIRRPFEGALAPLLIHTNRLVRVEGQVEGARRFFRSLARALWQRPSQRRAAIHLSQAIAEQFGIVPEAVPIRELLDSNPDMAAEAARALLVAEAKGLDWEASALRQLLALSSGEVRTLARLLADRPNAWPAGSGNHVPLPSQRLLRSVAELQEGNPDSVAGLIRDLELFVPWTIAGAERNALTAQVAVLLADLVAPVDDTLQHQALRTAARHAVRYLRRVSLTLGRVVPLDWYGLVRPNRTEGLDAVVRVLAALVRGGLVEDAAEVCRELRYVARLEVIWPTLIEWPEGDVYRALRDRQVAQVVRDELIEPLLESLPEWAERTRQRWSRYRRWAAHTLGEPIEPGIVLGIWQLGEGKVRLFWQVSPDHDPLAYREPGRMVAPAWWRRIQQRFVPASRAIRPQGLRVVLETSSTGRVFSPVGDYPADLNWDPDLGVAGVEWRAPAEFTWLRLRLVRGEETVAMSQPVAVGGRLAETEMRVGARLPQRAGWVSWPAQQLALPMVGVGVSCGSGQLWLRSREAVEPGQWVVVSWWHDGRASQWKLVVRGVEREGRCAGRLGGPVFEQRLFAPPRYVAAGPLLSEGRGGEGAVEVVPACFAPCDFEIRTDAGAGVAVQLIWARAADVGMLKP